jgi:ABC-type dipeptide/oligopeptide/nickel transport system ATPase component
MQRPGHLVAVAAAASETAPINLSGLAQRYAEIVRRRHQVDEGRSDEVIRYIRALRLWKRYGGHQGALAKLDQPGALPPVERQDLWLADPDLPSATGAVTDEVTDELPQLGARGVLSSRRTRAQARRWLQEIDVDVNTVDRPVSTLSGGNQQRILLARCLYTNPSILVLAEPIAGVDVGARQALYALLRERAQQTGLSILIASSDVEDLISVCDRVIVLVGGRVAAEMSGAEIDAERIVSVMENIA